MVYRNEKKRKWELDGSDGGESGDRSEGNSVRRERKKSGKVEHSITSKRNQIRQSSEGSESPVSNKGR